MSAAVTELLVATASLRPIELAEVMESAALQTRVDRKYLLDPASFARLVADFELELRVLEIDGLRVFRYESVYFDTAAMTAYYRSASSRSRTSFKVRTRTYLDSGECVLEVKSKGQRGQTIKKRHPYRLDQRASLDPSALRFVDGLVQLPDDAGTLRPVLATHYRRATLVDPVNGVRITCDAGLACTDPDGRTAVMRDAVLVESKSAGRPSAIDRWLWRHGQRPVTISKFCVGVAALHPELPANKWNRTLRRFFDRNGAIHQPSISAAGLGAR